MLRTIQVQLEDDSLSAFGEETAFTAEDGTESSMTRPVTDLDLMTETLEKRPVDGLFSLGKIEEDVSIGHVDLLVSSFAEHQRGEKGRKSLSGCQANSRWNGGLVAPATLEEPHHRTPIVLAVYLGRSIASIGSGGGTAGQSLDLTGDDQDRGRVLVRLQ